MKEREISTLGTNENPNQPEKDPGVFSNWRKYIQHGVCGVMGTLAGFSAFEAIAATKCDISYLWHPEKAAVLEYREDVARVLGSDLNGKLIPVKGKKNYGLIWDRDASCDKAKEFASRHSKELERSDLDSAGIVRDTGDYHQLYNVVFGTGRDLEALKKQFKVVYDYLGNGIGRNLYIEELSRGRYAIVYKRGGDRASTYKRSQELDKKLRRKGVDASIIPEDGNEVIFGEASLLHEEDEKERPKKKKTKKIKKAKKKVYEKSKKQAKKKKRVSKLGGADIERQIERYIADVRRRGFLKPHMKTAWSAFDFCTGEKLVDINEDEPMQAASMVKPLVALAFFHEVKHGSMKYGKTSKKEMERMIQRSSNGATNWFIDRLGGPRRVQSILKRNYGSILEDIQIVERIPAGGRTYRNKVSAHDYSRFLYALWEGDLPYAREMRRVMALPGGDRLYRGVPNIPKGTGVYNKTGSTARAIGDMGILVGRIKGSGKCPYTMIGIIESKKRESYRRFARISGNIIRKVSGIVYRGMKARHNLR